MSKLSSQNESRVLISIDSSEKIEQLRIIDEGSISTGKDHSNSTESVFSEKLIKNVYIDELCNESDKSIKIKEHKYPLTEKFKREMANKIRIGRLRKSKQINNINEKIIHSTKAIKNQMRWNNVKKIDSLRKINNSQWHYDRICVHDLQNSSLNDKIDALELNLKQLEKELIIEKKRFTNVKEYSTANNENNDIVSDENTISTDINNSNEEIINKDPLNTIKSNDERKFMDVCSVINNNYVNVYDLNLKTQLTFRPICIEFKVKLNENENSISKELLKVTNCSKNIIMCRYSHLLDRNSIFQNNTNIINVKTVATYRIQPAITIDYVVTFKSLELQNSSTYMNSDGVMLVFETIETESNNRPNIKYLYHIPIKFCMCKPEPELITKTINFPVLLESKNNINSKRYLILQNNGDADCTFSVIKETDYQRSSNNDVSISLNLTNERNNDFHEDDVFHSIVVHNNLNYFIWKNHINVLLPANGTVKVPVIFDQNLASSTISEYFTIEFDNTNYIIPNQKVNVIGQVKNENIIIKPDVIDAGLCYLTSSIQAVSFTVQNKNRIAIPFRIKPPSELFKHVELNPSKGILKAESSLEICVQLCLKYDILHPNDCEMYYNVDTGVLDFPVHVYLSNCKIPYDVRIHAVVTTSFGLRLSPDHLDFGTVNTTETVVRNIMLTNHSRYTIEYGFLKLPERVSVYPSAFGSIFSSEEICLHVHYSPSAKIFPPKVYLFEDEFILTCSTITGLNAEQFNSEVEVNKQFHEEISEELTITNLDSTINIKELDHGPNKIQITRPKNTVEIESLDENTILKEATIKCRANIHDIPVELSVQKIIFEKTHFSSYSRFKFELRASNLASVFERNIKTFPDFKIKFEFVSNEPSIEFKPKNGILQSKEVIQIYITFRPKLDDEFQKMYYECLDCKETIVEIQNILDDKNSFVNQLYRSKSFLHEHTNIFEGKKLFYSLMADETKIIPAVCFTRFIDRKSIEHFGFDTGSLKLSLVCPTTKPNVILFVDRINFGKCTIDVRHDEWLLAQNITMRSVPLRISLADPIGPFFCALALKGEQILSPGEIIKINISFVPENETTVYDILEVKSETMRLDVKLRGSGLRPSCKITPDDVFTTILNMPDNQPNNNYYIFRVTNTGDIRVPFNVQMEWSKERLEQMTDDEAFGFVNRLRENCVDSTMTLFDGSDWLELKDDDVFNLGNDGVPLRFYLDPDAERYVQVTFRSPLHSALELQNVNEEDIKHVEDESGSYQNDRDRDIVFRHRIYVAKFNVHVGRSILYQFHVFGFGEETAACK